MSSFSGILNFQPVPISEEGQVDIHEESDDLEFYQDEYIYLSMNLSQSSNYQPLTSSDQPYVLAFDGGIYNITELRDQLENLGYLFNTDTVAEVILNLFIEYGEHAFIKLRGTFAIVIWDQEEKILYVARDRFGVKPLYFSKTKKSIAFASDKKMLNNPQSLKLNTQSLQHYFSFQYVPEPLTLDQQVEKLEPGYYFVQGLNEKITFERYWKPSFAPVHREYNQWIAHIRDQLMESVEARMQSDKSIGSFLSGGIDSSLIVALAKQIDPSIKTFSVGFEREGFSEVDVAKQTAEHLGVENYVKMITPDEYMESLPQIIWHMDDPLADPACVPLYFAAKEAKKHVDIIFSGEGADELFGGYNIYREPQALKFFDHIPDKMNRMLNQLAQIIPEGIKGKSYLERGTIPLEDRYIGNAKIFENDELEQLLLVFDPRINYQQVTSKFYQEVAGLHAVEKMQYIDLHTWLRGDILLKASRMMSAHSLELRVPFLDQKVFDLAMGIPVDLKIAKGTTKHILREAAKGIVPDHVIGRKKIGFPVPIRHWLKNEMYDWAHSIILSSETCHLINKRYVLELLDLHCRGKRDYSRKIWTVIVFMIWYQIFVESDQGRECKNNQKRAVVVD